MGVATARVSSSVGVPRALLTHLDEQVIVVATGRQWGCPARQKWGKKLKKLLMAGALALTALALPATASAHGGPPVDVFTETFKGSDVLPFQGPCGGGPGIVSVEFNDMFHVTGFEDGHYTVVGNQIGTFEFEPLDPNEPSSSGRYRNGFRDVAVQNGLSFSSRFVVNGTFDDGSKLKFQIKQTFVVANGEIRVDRFDVSC
jgi:hypothetical protein